ncbi:MAG: formylglycine-generating enzyme family protein [Planctomycetales bacterium]
MGKSILLLFAEGSIAYREQSPLVPLRIGKTDGDSPTLSSVNWKGTVDQTRQVLLERFLGRYVPKDFEARGLTWLKYKMDHGEVVFLLDALDQIHSPVDGLGTFLQAKGVRSCPVLLTGRPEAMDTVEAFAGNDWTTLELLPFGKDEQVRLLGARAAAELLPERESVDFRSTVDEVRRHGWKDLLEVPLLLKLLKDLSQPQEGGQPSRLSMITNRYSLYCQATEHLIDQGLKSLLQSESRNIRIDRDEVFSLLKKLAWLTVSRHDFSATLRSKLKEDAKAIIGKNEFVALQQINVLSGHGLFDRLSPGGIEWRHRSFMEFYAGCVLAEQMAAHRDGKPPANSPDSLGLLLNAIHETSADDRSSIRSRATGVEEDPPGWRDRRGDWQETLRFALTAAEEGARDALARELIARGNPWVVYDTIDRDRLSLGEETARTVRWLVHRNLTYKRDYSKAHAANASRPALAANVQPILEQSPQLGWRDSACLVPACELLDGWSVEELDLRDPFALVRRLTPRFQREGVAFQKSQPQALKTFFQEQFVPLPDGTLNAWEFHPMNTVSEWRKMRVRKPYRIPIRGIELADFPVTNELWELFEPGHRRWRNEYSSHGEQPAVYVNWFMANAFCTWLTACDPQGRKYRLPTEWEWEYACRWGTGSEYWWGNDPIEDLLNSSKKFGLRRTNSRDEAIERFQAANAWHPSRTNDPAGLLDMHGNVWEWCASLREAAGFVVRGGSWGNNARDSRSSDYLDLNAVTRSYVIGFRVCRVSGSSEASSS